MTFHPFLPGEIKMNENKFLTEILNGKCLHLFSHRKYSRYLAQFFNVIMQVLFMSSAMLYIFLFFKQQRGVSKQIICTFFFILEDEHSLGTKIFMIIETLSKKWWKQNLGTEYGTCIIVSVDNQYTKILHLVMLK